MPKFWKPAKRAYIVLSIPLVHNLLVKRTMGKNACMEIMGAIMLSPNMYIHLSGMPIAMFQRLVIIMSNMPAQILKKVVNIKIRRMLLVFNFHWKSKSPKRPKTADTKDDPKRTTQQLKLVVVHKSTQKHTTDM